MRSLRPNPKPPPQVKGLRSIGNHEAADDIETALGYPDLTMCGFEAFMVLQNLERHSHEGP